MCGVLLCIEFAFEKYFLENFWEKTPQVFDEKLRHNAAYFCSEFYLKNNSIVRTR